jgi:ABC-2 type transport system ATP-binding protein
MTAAIETRSLRKRYRRVEALRGVDFEVPEGSVCGFLGPNGAGKSTTMEILMGLIRSSGGWASILGDDLDGDGLMTRSRIGYLPQDPSFYPRTKVRGILRFVARRYLDGSRASLDAKVDETLGLVGLTDLADRRVKALSGGELRRLGIGQAIIGDPELLILDEPSVGLDPEGRFQVLALLDQLKERMTIFYSSHILDDVERVADHIVVIDRGEIVEQGSMNRYLGGQGVYRVTLDGGVGDGAVRGLEHEPWVDNVTSMGGREWRIETPDRTVAEKKLMRFLVKSDGARVIAMRPAYRSLEDLYMELVGDADDH